MDAPTLALIVVVPIAQWNAIMMTIRSAKALVGKPLQIGAALALTFTPLVIAFIPSTKTWLHVLALIPIALFQAWLLHRWNRQDSETRTNLTP